MDGGHLFSGTVVAKNGTFAAGWPWSCCGVDCFGGVVYLYATSKGVDVAKYGCGGLRTAFAVPTTNWCSDRHQWDVGAVEQRDSNRGGMRGKVSRKPQL